ncbi:MAG TPA: TonB family protein [Burkholderiales bacterium]|nr:TonB family protein [Burkholderiales bacterium]
MASVHQPAGMSAYHLRLGGFLALSIALHALTLLGAGPFDPSARRFGDAPGRPELHATLAPANQPQREANQLRATKNDELLPRRESLQETSPARSESAPRPGQAGSEGGLALPESEKWYTAREVDVRAEPLTQIDLRYPENLPRVLARGKVRIRLFIDERGVVRKAQIAGSEPAGLFDESAKEIWQDVRFSPALKDGVAVKSQKLIELTYNPRAF